MTDERNALIMWLEDHLVLSEERRKGLHDKTTEELGRWKEDVINDEIADLRHG